jgi:hypothetical protein
MGAVTADATSVLVTFGQGHDALRRGLRVVHRKFTNAGGWSLSFVLFAADHPPSVGVSAKRTHLEA